MSNTPPREEPDLSKEESDDLDAFWDSMDDDDEDEEEPPP